MSCFITTIFAYFITQYVNGGCHDIYLLEEAKTSRLSRVSQYGRITSLAEKCLEISTVDPDDVTKDGQKVQIWDCVDTVSQQQWYYTSDNEIQNEKGYCLDVDLPAWENREPGSRVQIWKCNGWDNQKWYPFDGYLISSNLMCLDIGVEDVNNNAGVVQMWECNGWDNQKWTLNKGTSVSPIERWGETIIIGDFEVFEGGAKWNECPDGFAIVGFQKGDCEDIWCIENISCASPDSTIDQECYDENIKGPFDGEANVSCDEGYFIRGIYNSDYETKICEGLACLETLRCCKWDEDYIQIDGDKDNTQDWKSCFDSDNTGWCSVDNGEYITGLYRDVVDYAYKFAPLLKFDSSASKYGYPMDPQKYIDNGEGDYENNILDTASNPTYYRMEQCGDTGDYKISYWWFYGYQHACDAFGSGSHDGDWERVVINVNIFQCSIKSVTFYQHSGYYTLRDGQFEQNGDRTIVYVGKIGHGSYFNSNNYFAGSIPILIGCGYYYDYRDPDSDNDWLWTNRNLINMNTSNDSWIVDKVDICCSNPFTTDICNINGCDGSDCNVFNVESCDAAGCNVWECDEKSDLAASPLCCIFKAACPPTPQPIDDGNGPPCQPWPACEPI